MTSAKTMSSITVGETTINPENILIEYSIVDGKLTYELIYPITKTKEIVGSHASGKDKQSSMGKVFADFRYINDTKTQREVNLEFLKIKYDDLLEDLVDIYNFFQKKKSGLSVKYPKESKDLLFEKRDAVGIELGKLFADLRYRKNEQAKFDIISEVLTLTEKDQKHSTVSRKKESSFEFISSHIHREAMKKNLIYNYYFNQKIPLEGDYIFKNDYEIIDRMVENEEDVFLVYLVFANLEKLKEKDLGLLNRLARYIEYSPKHIGEYAYQHSREIKEAVDYTWIQGIDIMALVRHEALKMAKKEKVHIYVRDKKEIWEYLEKMKENKPKVYEKLLKEHVIAYDPHIDTIASFLETMKEYNKYIGREIGDYSKRYAIYPYLKSVKPKDIWSSLSEMLIPDDSKRKMVINQLVDYYEKKYEVDQVEAMEYLKEDLEKLRPDETSRHDKELMRKYPEHFKIFTGKLNKDLAYLGSQIESMTKFKPGAIGFKKTKKEFEDKLPKKMSPKNKTPPKRKTSPIRKTPKKCPEGKVLNPEGNRCINEGGPAHLRHLERGAYDEVTTAKYSHLLEKKTPKKRGRPKGSGKKTTTKVSPRKTSRSRSPMKSPKKASPKKCPEGKVSNPQGTRCINEGGVAHIRYLKEGKYDEVAIEKYYHLLIKKKPGRPKGSGNK